MQRMRSILVDCCEAKHQFATENNVMNLKIISSSTDIDGHLSKLHMMIA